MKIPELKDKLNKAFDHLLDDFATVRGNRAQSSLIENIKIEAYPGTFLTIRELGAITVPDPQMILVEVWDSGVVDSVARGITGAGTGLNGVVDGKLIKITVPQLSQERRQQLAKIVSQKTEEAKVTIRNIRHDALSSLEEQKENSVVSEDEYFSQKEQIEKEVQEINSKIIAKGKEKEQEILTI